MIMLGRNMRSDPVSNHLLNKLGSYGILNYDVVVAFCGGPWYAVAVERMIFFFFFYSTYLYRLTIQTQVSVLPLFCLCK